MENLVLLADQNSNAWAFAEKIKEYIKENKKEEVKLQNIPISLFRNKEIEINPTANLRKKDVYYIQDSTKNPQQWWVELLLIKDMALSSSANSLTFVLPDMCYSRQDRKIKSRVPISARALASSISLGTKKIITMDLHSGQIQGFYPATTPLDNLYSFPEVVRHLIKNYSEELKNFLILSPDAGGVARARSFLRRIEESTGNKCDLAFMIKERARPGEVGEMRYVGPDPEGKAIFIVDDLVDSGGTLCSAAEVMKQKGASKIFCYATHGLFTEGTIKFNKFFDKILISNTHNYPDSFFEGVEIIDVSPLFAEAIYRAQKGFSISELFD